MTNLPARRKLHLKRLVAPLLVAPALVGFGLAGSPAQAQSGSTTPPVTQTPPGPTPPAGPTPPEQVAPPSTTGAGGRLPEGGVPERSYSIDQNRQSPAANSGSVPATGGMGGLQPK